MIDRRVTPDPIPPDGIEHRGCADPKCITTHRDWLIQEAMPKMMIKFASMILAAVTILSAVFLYMSRNAIRDFALEAKSQYVSIPLHQSDISRVERKIDWLESTLSEQIQDVADKIDSIKEAKH